MYFGARAIHLTYAPPPPIEGPGYPMGGGCIVKFSKGVTQRIFLIKAKIFISKGGMISNGDEWDFLGGNSQKLHPRGSKHFYILRG